MNARELYELFIESSSLRTDLLIEVGGALRDILNNIELNDELCARVDEKTFAFIKSYKEGK